MCVCKIFRTYLFIYLLIFNKLIECILFGTRCQNWQYLVQQMFLFLAKSPRLVTKRRGSANQDSSGKNWPSQSLMLFWGFTKFHLEWETHEKREDLKKRRS